MKNLLKTFGIGAVLAATSVVGVVVVGATTTPPPPPPIQGAQLAVVVNGDTVTGSGAHGVSGPTGTCAQTNFFKVGGVVVFRIWGTDVVGGGYSLTPTNVKSAVVNIPPAAAGGTPIVLTLNYVGEPYNAPPSKQIGYWEAPWTVPAGYPLGVVNFKVVMKTKGTSVFPSFTGRWSQAHLAANSQLQITA